jgi:D-serine deaminase-like pyridoxal phosphate-dependent protein
MEIIKPTSSSAGFASLLATPCACLDLEKLDRNIAKMQTRVAETGWSFRPHVKTSKSVDVTRRCFAPSGIGPITVSTIREAEYFADAGFTDVLYAVSIVPAKLPRIEALLRRGVRTQVLLDDPEVAIGIASDVAAAGLKLGVWIEVDCDGHRAGIPLNRQPEIIELAQLIHEQAGLELAGVLTHAGESYLCRSQADLRTAAIAEQNSLATVAEAIEKNGVPCPGRSIGSSPTGISGTQNAGITELRAGVFIFQDLFQSNLGVCGVKDIALSVLTTVISHRRDLGWLIVDAGGIALSKDRGTAKQVIDYGYGLVCDVNGIPIQDHLVTDANQEHGIIKNTAGEIDFDRHPIGSRLRILPNHACMTAAAYEGYHVWLNGQIEFWNRINGW